MEMNIMDHNAKTIDGTITQVNTDTIFEAIGFAAIKPVKAARITLEGVDGMKHEASFPYDGGEFGVVALCATLENMAASYQENVVKVPFVGDEIRYCITIKSGPYKGAKFSHARDV
jgi:hypothetical protein